MADIESRIDILEDLRRHARPGTQIVLVKTNVCQLLDTKLRELGFNVANRGNPIPFPSSGQQGNFRIALSNVFRK